MHKMPYVLNSIISQLFSEYIYRVLALIAAMSLMLVSNVSSAFMIYHTANDMPSYRRHLQQMLVIIGVLLFSLASGSAFAFENNPGSNAVCPAGSTKGFLSSGSYSDVLNSFTSKDYKNVSSQTTFSGNTAANISLKIKMSIDDIEIENSGNNTTISGTTTNPAIDINRNFNSPTSYSNITLEFQDSKNGKVTYLDKVALSVFDIDKSVSSRTGWDDLIKITGVTENDGIIEGTLQTIPNSIVTKLTNGLQTSSTSNSYNCTSSLQSACQGSVLFNKPVKSVTLIYGNTNNVTSPTTQRIQLRLDSYCYTPQYTFTGSVFNDNGGIPAIENTRQDITNTFTSNSNYFNGIFDSSGNNRDSGIGATGLQVRLTNCGPNGGTNITGTTAQNILETSVPLGQYKFMVPASLLVGVAKICIVQVEPNNWEYNVDTTSNVREVNLVANVFDYKTESDGSRNLDFGEVQASNASLVLIKSQYGHSCNINSDYNGISGTSSQIPVFSIAEIKEIDSGKCIAYRIEAYNRGHIDLKDIQITDTLQTAPIKSVFVSPLPLGAPITINNNVNTLPVDKILSNKFDLLKTTSSSPTKATLYFNTKYGTTVNP